jgi:hypothetical protein
MRVKTNYTPRHVIYGFELSDKERAEFDYLTEDEIVDRQFVRYRGVTYDLGDFQITTGLPADSPLRQWHGFQADSFYSGVVVRYAHSCESVICGTFTA